MHSLWQSIFIFNFFILPSMAYILSNIHAKTPIKNHKKTNPLDNSPLLLRTALGQNVERTPVWMMRQAGRHMAVYRELCESHKTFRERSENPDLATEISLQPWRAYKTDGCILFSDILTPLPGMGIDFDIEEKIGPKIKPYRTMDDVNTIKLMDPYKSCAFVGEALKNICHEVKNEATVLGFIGLPYTLASYLVEGKSSIGFKNIKQMSYLDKGVVLHKMLNILSENITNYAIFQTENGAQVIQLFDSWAGNLSPSDYDTFALPYQKKVIDAIKEVHPKVPIIMYIHKSGALLEKIVASGADCISLDWTVSIEEARRRVGNSIVLQGNLDPMALYAPQEEIMKQTAAILEAGGGKNHIMNLGHGIDAETPESSAKLFVDFVKDYKIKKKVNLM